jgi:hypothetical protein
MVGVFFSGFSLDLQQGLSLEKPLLNEIGEVSALQLEPENMFQLTYNEDKEKSTCSKLPGVGFVCVGGCGIVGGFFLSYALLIYGVGAMTAGICLLY